MFWSHTVGVHNCSLRSKGLVMVSGLRDYLQGVIKTHVYSQQVQSYSMVSFFLSFFHVALSKARTDWACWHRIKESDFYRKVKENWNHLNSQRFALRSLLALFEPSESFRWASLPLFCDVGFHKKLLLETNWLQLARNHLGCNVTDYQAHVRAWAT